MDAGTFAIVAEPQDLVAALSAKFGDRVDRLRLNPAALGPELAAQAIQTLHSA